jgi:hypothetical protein
MADTLPQNPLLSNPIIDLLKAAPNPYINYNDPQYGAGPLTAYNYICQQLKISGDLRSYYYTTDYNQLTGFWNTLNNINIQADLLPPEGLGIAQQDWDNVKTEILDELLYASNISSYFADLEHVVDDCFALQTAQFNLILNGLGLDGSGQQSISGMVSTVVIGLTTTVASELIPGASLFAGLLATTAEVYTQAENYQPTEQPPNEFDVKVELLMSTLISEFLALKDNLTGIWEAIVNDAGKAEAFYLLKGEGNAATGSYWKNPKVKQQIVKATAKAFELEILKLLLPIDHCIYYGYLNNRLSPGEVRYWESVDPVTWDSEKLNFLQYTPQLKVPYNGSNFVNSSNVFSSDKLYWIATKANATAYLDSKAIYDLINGFTDVFLGVNGWNLIPTYFEYTTGLAIRVVNNSSLPVSFQGTCQSDFYLTYEKMTGPGGKTHDFASYQDTINMYIPVGGAVDFQGSATISPINTNHFDMVLSGTGFSYETLCHITVGLSVTGREVQISEQGNAVYGPTTVQTLGNNVVSGGNHGGGCLILISDTL